jgi:alpha-D-ribose 1-methylphosphonate 5-triphosphate synthase subunit PhnL
MRLRLRIRTLTLGYFSQILKLVTVISLFETLEAVTLMKPTMEPTHYNKQENKKLSHFTLNVEPSNVMKQKISQPTVETLFLQ